MSGANWPVRRSGGLPLRAEGLWTAEPDTVPTLCGAAVRPACRVLGSGEDASVRAHLPLSDHPECVADCGAGCLTSGYRCPL